MLCETTSKKIYDTHSFFLSSQGTDVDAVSGATYSSTGIIEAVKNALGINSGITLESTVPSYTQETVQPSTQATTDVTESTTEVTSDESEVKTVTETTTEESLEKTETQSSQSSGALQDGTYTGTGKGRNGDVAVTVTVTGEKSPQSTLNPPRRMRRIWKEQKV